MTQKIDPFIQLNWGWDTGEGGWGEGMNQNLITYAFLQNKRIDSVISSASLLPAVPVNGTAYFAVADVTIYLRAEGVWYTLLPTVGMEFILKATEERVKFNGTTLVTSTKLISEVTGLQAALDLKVDESTVGAVSGVAPLGVDGKVPAAYLPASGSYLGTWDATTNTPTIVSGVGSNGEFYKVSQGGSVTIDGISSWSAGDEIRFNGTVWQRVPNTNTVSSVNGEVGVVVLDYADVGAAASSHSHSNATTSVAGFLSASDKTKLDGIATGATLNSPDATLLARANHTGTQAQSTVVNLVTDLSAKQATLVSGTNIKTIDGVSILGSGNITTGTGGSPTFLGLTDTPSSYSTKAFQIPRVNTGETALEFVALGSAAFNNTGDFATSSHTHGNATTSLAGFMSAADKTKIDSVASGATANSSDATLLARANHTGTQTASTISDFNTAADARVVAGITGKENTITAGTASQYWRGDKSWQTLDKASVGLSNVDNTSDATKNSASVVLTNKTISGSSNTFSNIPQSAVTGIVSDLALKAPLTSPIFSGAVVLPSNTAIGSVGGTEISYLSGVSSGIQSQINGKQASLGFTPVNKAGDSGVGEIGLSKLTVNRNNNALDGSTETTSAIDIVHLATGTTRLLVGIDNTNNVSYIESMNTGFGWAGRPLFLQPHGGEVHFGGAVQSLGNFTTTGIISGNGSNITSLNASNLSTGTLSAARLPAGTTSAAGILQVTDSTSSTSTTTAASPNSVRTAYLLAEAAVTKSTPSQLFQSLGTVNGSVTVNGASGTHVLATVNGNTTWTFPTPSATEALALTLELTNGGAYTMTWPSGIRWTGGVAPTLTASGTDVLVFTKAGTNNWRGYLSSKDSK